MSNTTHASIAAEVSTNPWRHLLDPASDEQSIWHSRPLGRHGLGLLHCRGMYADDAPRSAEDTENSEYDVRYWPAKHWPAVTVSTVHSVVFDAINIWVEDDDQGPSRISRDAFSRVHWQWFPTHLDVTWRADAITIQLRAAMIDGDSAKVSVQVRNEGDRRWGGRLIVQGDANWLNVNMRGHAWWKVSGQHRWVDRQRVVVEKSVGAGLSNEFFPDFNTLKPEDQTFDWVWQYFQMAFEVAGDGWEAGDEPTGHDGHVTWRQRKALDLNPGQTHDFDVRIACKWHGRKAIPAGAAAELARQLDDVRFVAPQKQIVRANRSLWESFYAKLPEPGPRWSDAVRRLYYKAWTSIYYNTVPATDMIFYDSKLPIGVCNKVAPSSVATCPATWESALIALAMSLVDPKLACDLIEAIYQPIREDGYISEMPGFVQITHLPAVEPFVVWACYEASGDRAFLERVYAPMRLNLLYKLRHPTWRDFGPKNVRNYAYGHISARYALRIAKLINRPTAELEQLECAIVGTRRAIDAFWDEEHGYYRADFVPAVGMLGGEAMYRHTHAETLLPLYLAAKPQRRARLLELLRDQFVREDGVITRDPRDLPRPEFIPASQQTFTIKESNLMFLYKAIKDADRALFDRIVDGTIANIAKTNDFFECYQDDGLGRHNGPGSIFGAFAVVWGILVADGRVDHLYITD